MKVPPSKSFGIFMMSLSAVFLIATVVSLLYCIPDPNGVDWLQRGLSMADDQASFDMRQHNPYDYTASVPSVHSELVFPYRWLTRPLTIVGTSFLLIGLFLYRDELFGILH